MAQTVTLEFTSDIFATNRTARTFTDESSALAALGAHHAWTFAATPVPADWTELADCVDVQSQRYAEFLDDCELDLAD